MANRKSQQLAFVIVIALFLIAPLLSCKKEEPAPAAKLPEKKEAPPPPPAVKKVILPALDRKMPDSPPVILIVENLRVVAAEQRIAAPSLLALLLGESIAEAGGPKKAKPGQSTHSIHQPNDIEITDDNGTYQSWGDGYFIKKDNDGWVEWCNGAQGCGMQSPADQGGKVFEYPYGKGLSDQELMDEKQKGIEKGAKKMLDWSPPVPTSGGSGTGEPHYMTMDGVPFDSQKAGEFVLHKSDGHEIQVRQEPYGKDNVAVITAAAFDVSGHRVGIYLKPEPRVLVDGKAIPASPFQQIDLQKGGAVGVWTKPLTVVVVWPDLSRTFVLSPTGNWLDVLPAWFGSASVQSRGLLGIDSQTPDNHLTARDGTRISRENTQAVQTQFLESWRITQSESLFHYANSESTATYTDLHFPRAPRVLTAEERSRAEQICRANEVPQGFAFDSCVYDVGVTGDEQFAHSARDVGTRLEGTKLIAGALIPEAQSGITLDEKELANAEKPAGEMRGTLKKGSSKLYLVELTQGLRLHVLSNKLGCEKQWKPAEQIGYAFFKPDGTRISGPFPACSDSVPAAADAGQYYIKVVATPQYEGTGEYDLKYYPN